MRLKSKIALITGASKGIGLAIAKLFVENGATCILSDIDDIQGEKEAKLLGLPNRYLHLNVALEADWQKAMDFIIQEYGQLDILINNAGIIGLEEGFGPQDPENLSLKDWRKVHEVNADSVFLGCKYALKTMKKFHTGSIINMSSRSGLVGIPGASAYASSKASVRNHTKSVALYAQEKGYNIRANSIHPAAILTPLWDPMIGSTGSREKNLEEIAKNIPMKKMGDPIDVAYAALYLSSEEAKYVTGIELTIDGGILAGASSSPKKMDE